MRDVASSESESFGTEHSDGIVRGVVMGDAEDTTLADSACADAAVGAPSRAG